MLVEGASYRACRTENVDGGDVRWRRKQAKLGSTTVMHYDTWICCCVCKTHHNSIALDSRKRTSPCHKLPSLQTSLKRREMRRRLGSGEFTSRCETTSRLRCLGDNFQPRAITYRVSILECSSIKQYVTNEHLLSGRPSTRLKLLWCHIIHYAKVKSTPP